MCWPAATAPRQRPLWKRRGCTWHGSNTRHAGEFRTRRGDHHVVFDLCANAFLHHMVRNIVGCLVYVGKGKYPPEWVGEVLAGRDRARAAPTIEAAGLYLVRVEYEARWGIPDAPRRTLMEMGNGE